MIVTNYNLSFCNLELCGLTYEDIKPVLGDHTFSNDSLNITYGWNFSINNESYYIYDMNKSFTYNTWSLIGGSEDFWQKLFPKARVYNV